MKKSLLITVVLFAICASVKAGSGTIAAAATTAEFTNDASLGRIVYLQNVAVKMATATNDTFQIFVKKGGVDYQVATVAVTTNSVYGNTVITNQIPVGPGGEYSIVRAVTNFAANVYIDAR